MIDENRMHYTPEVYFKTAEEMREVFRDYPEACDATLEIAERCELINVDEWSFLWVVDAPVFEAVVDDDGTQGWTAVHHPFTAPNADWIDRFEESPGEALANAYDLVCNGNEIGGGSIRIHQEHVQSLMFKLLGMSVEDARSKFGFLLDALEFGTPPHGGIASMAGST